MYSAGAGAPARPQKSKALGAIGLGIVLVTGVIMCALCWVIGDAMATFLVESGVDLRAAQDTGDLISDARVMEFADGLGIQTAIVQGCAILGFAGWIVSIVAAITGRGRAMGVIGLIVGIFVPIVAFGVGIMGLLPALEGIGA